jgi:type I restriction enzyme, S subunit
MKWPTVPLRLLCERTPLRAPRPEESFTYIDIASVDKEEKVVVNPSKLLGVDAPSRARKEVRSGDIIVSTVRPNLNAVAMIPGNLDHLIASTGFCVLRIRTDLALPQYCFYWTQTISFINYLVARARGASYPAVSDSVVLSCPVPLPPLSEQRRIVALLDNLDALSRMRKHADTLTGRYLQAHYLKTFGDPQVNPKNWPLVRVRDIANIIVPTRDKPKRFVGAIPWVTLPDVEEMFVSSAKHFLDHADAAEVGNRLMPQGTVLLSCAGTLGRIAITEREVYANQQFYGLVPRPEEMSPLFLAWTLRLKGQRFYEALAGVSTLGFFSKDRALDIQLVKPPRELQEDFATSAKSFRLTELKQAAARMSLAQLRGNILEQAFSGSMTARWREAHIAELRLELENQEILLKDVTKEHFTPA